ncbi:MAG: cell division protein FtsK, partial [Pseudonocardia sp.]|nr:cell division protein FtsK [Pseudonocardia sp.]
MTSKVRRPWWLVLLGVLLVAAGRFVVGCGRHVWLTGTAAVLVAVWVQWDWPAVALVVAVAVGVLFGWRALHGASWSTWVGVPSRSSWRKAVVYRRHWQPAMVLSDLADTFARRDYLPVL